MFCLVADIVQVADQDRMSNAEIQSRFRGCQGNFIIRNHYRNALRSDRLRTLTQLNETVDHLQLRRAYRLNCIADHSFPTFTLRTVDRQLRLKKRLMR